MVTKALMKRILKTADTVKHGDLYNALHQVGDDPVKADIEETLEELLAPDVFKQVVAVFKLAVED
jgi:hypothetical protein